MLLEQFWRKRQAAWARKVPGEISWIKVVPAGSAEELGLLAFSTEGIQVPLAKIGNKRSSSCGARGN